MLWSGGFAVIQNSSEVSKTLLKYLWGEHHVVIASFRLRKKRLEL